MSSFDGEGLYVDHYELTMAQGFLVAGRSETPAVFDYFFRTAPFGGGYAVFAGLGELLEHLSELSFDSDDCAYLLDSGFQRGFVDYLSQFRFLGTVCSCREGEVVFATEPILRVEGSLLEAQLVETAVLNYLNYPSLVATKAARVVDAAGNAPVVDFGLRRAQGAGGVTGSRAALIGGCRGTSNMYAGSTYGVGSTGTMAHSWIQAFGSDREAFAAYAERYPDSCILLIDTFDTIESGLPAAIATAKALEDRGHHLAGVRLDSGDLAYLSKHVRTTLDRAGFDYVQILVSNQLDEYVIQSLRRQNAPIDAYGVGTKLITGAPDAALDGVYKLSSIDGEPTQKLSDDPGKTSLPGRKEVLRYSDDQGAFAFDGIVVAGRKTPSSIHHLIHPDTKSTEVTGFSPEVLLTEVMSRGVATNASPTVAEIRDYAASRIARLPEEHRRFENPHVYRVGASMELIELRSEITRRIETEIHGRD